MCRYGAREFPGAIGKNPFDIEHIWPDKYNHYRNKFDSADEFDAWRNDVAALLLLPADVNRSYQDQPFEVKAPHYAKQNFYAASLTASAYQHQPQFAAFQKANKLAFMPYVSFNTEAQQERGELLLALVNIIWSAARLEKLRR